MNALREKIFHSSLMAIDDSKCQIAEQSFNLASSPIPFPPKDDDSLVFIIAVKVRVGKDSTYNNKVPGV